MLIAQISDIHAAAGNENLARFDRALSWLATMRPDVLVLTGDLVDDDWQQGYRQVMAATQILECRTLALPGNADNRALMRATIPELCGAGDGTAMHFVERIGEALIIGLDIWVEAMAHGDVTPHLGWLRRVFESDLPGSPLLFLHQHVFASGIAPLDDVMCEGADALAELLSTDIRRPVAIASGHVHRPMSSLVAGVPAYICGSICPANPLALDPTSEPAVNDPPALMIHDLRNGRLVSSHVSV